VLAPPRRAASSLWKHQGFSGFSGGGSDGDGGEGSKEKEEPAWAATSIVGADPQSGNTVINVNHSSTTVPYGTLQSYILSNGLILLKNGKGYTATGFKINKNLVKGSVLCFTDQFVSWGVTSMEEVTPESLAILDLIGPLPEIFVLGCGARIQRVPEETRAFLRERCATIEP